MIQRHDFALIEDTPEGEFVRYTDHVAAMSELKDQGQAIVDRYEARLKEKDKEIERLKEKLVDYCVMMGKEDSDGV